MYNAKKVGTFILATIAITLVVGSIIALRQEAYRKAVIGKLINDGRLLVAQKFVTNDCTRPAIIAYDPQDKIYLKILVTPKQYIEAVPGEELIDYNRGQFVIAPAEIIKSPAKSLSSGEISTIMSGDTPTYSAEFKDKL